MSQNKKHNRRIVLAARPYGAPVSKDFRLETHPVPQPAEGQLLLRTVYLSLDPYMRGRMNDAPNAFMGLLDGHNFGKLVIRVNDEHSF